MSKKRNVGYIAIILCVVVVFLFVSVRTVDWTDWRRTPRVFEGTISDMKPEGGYFSSWWDVMVVNGTESIVFEVEEKYVMQPVFGKLSETCQVLNVGDYVKVTYHISVFDENMMDEIMIGEVENEK